jgi:hypothetical protein
MFLMKEVAIKKGQMRDVQPGCTEMGTLRCDGCGEEFTILHHPSVVDPTVAAQQAHWLEKVLADDHDRGRKHQDRILLP